jgi:two-component system aerobic respiration control sensor histidine kinase ArcB
MTSVSEDRHKPLNSSERKKKKREKILFVDDDPDITMLSKTALERNGFEVQTFETPISALENFKPGSYDLLLLDIKMRDMDGFELYDKLRKMDNNISVCFLTAASEYYDKYKQRYPWLAKECFITKPVAFERLVNTIDSVLN